MSSAVTNSSHVHYNNSGDYNWTTEVYSSNITTSGTLGDGEYNSRPEESGTLVSYAEKVSIVGVYGMITVLGVVFNIVTILVFTKGKRSSLRDIRVLIINLACIDIVYVLTGPMPTALELIHVPFPNSVDLCKLYRFTYVFSAYGSPLANLAIALERLIILFSPVRTLRLRNRQTVMLTIIGLMWAFNFIITAEYLVSPKLTIEGTMTYCDSNIHVSLVYPEVANWLIVVKFCTPAIVIVIIYAIIGAKLTLCRPVGTVSMDPHMKKQAKARRQVGCSLSHLLEQSVLYPKWL